MLKGQEVLEFFVHFNISTEMQLIMRDTQHQSSTRHTAKLFLKAHESMSTIVDSYVSPVFPPQRLLLPD